MNETPDASAFAAAPDDTDQQTPQGEMTSQPDTPAHEGDAPAERITTSTKLVRMAEAAYTFGIDDRGEPYAARRDHAPHLAYMLRDGKLGLRQHLAREFYDLEGRAASQSALADAMAVLHGKALLEPPRELHLRVADHDGSIWIDLGNAEGDVVEVTPSRVDMHKSAPVMFKRTEVGLPMAAPEPGGNIFDLFAFLNVQRIDQAPLLAALVAAFIPDMQHPIVTFTGEQGTGKTTAASLLMSLIDPSAAPTRKPPRGPEEFVNQMHGTWVVAFDNLSTVPIWLSDSLCRAVTGEGDVRRQLHTDSGQIVFSFKRPIMLTGIDFAGIRGDLADRLLLVELRRIPDTERLSESDLKRRWEAARPKLLGALLNLVAQVRQLLPKLQLTEMTRLADFVRVLTAVDQILDTKGLAHYRSQSAVLAADSLSTSPVAERIQAVREDFLGTGAELLARLAPDDPDERLPKGWPANARAVTSALVRDAPSLRKNGWRIDDRGLNRTGTKVWHILPPDATCMHGL